MNRELLLAVDIGTTNTKAAVFTPDRQKVTEAARRHRVESPKEDWAVHDAEEVWWKEFLEVIHEVLENPAVQKEKLCAMSISSLSPALLPIDRDGKALYPAMLYGLDRRARKEVAELTKMSRPSALKGERPDVSPISTGPKILWLKRNEPEIFEKTNYFVGAVTFLTYRLTGNLTADYGCYHIAGFPYNRRKMDWDDAMCRDCGITRDRLPELKFATEQAGQVTKKAAALTGLPEGLVVAVGTGDFLAETMCYGTKYHKMTQMSFGTTVGVDFGNDHCAILFPDYNPMESPQKTPGGAMSNGCSTIDWMIGMLSGETRVSNKVLEDWTRQAPAGAKGILLLPYLNGERTPFQDPEAKGLIFGLRSGHTKADLYQAALEGLAYSIRHMIEVYAPGKEGREAVVMGGGTRIPGLMQTVSNVTGYGLTFLDIYNGTLTGDAFLAGMAGGVFRERSDINMWIRLGGTVEPDLMLTDLYARGYEIYRGLYETNREWMHI